jgi:dienelactone hydrolase
VLPGALTRIRSPAMRELIEFDPLPVFGKLQRPTLALFGGRDMQAPPDENRPAFEAAFAGAGHIKPDVIVYPEANHLFMTAKTGHPAEYATLPKAFVSGFLDDVTKWIIEPGRHAEGR